MEVTYTELRQLVENGERIRWCGTPVDGRVSVQLIKNDTARFVTIDVDKVFDDWKCVGVIRNGEAINPMENTGYAPHNRDIFATMRKASVLGINISGDCMTQCGKEYVPISGCTCGYDIELDLRSEERGGFPLPTVPILSVALWCTCGFRKFISTLDIPRDDCIRVYKNTDFVKVTIDLIKDHMPLWLVGWNCYSFDNTCLVCNAEDGYLKYFNKVKIGSASGIDYGYILDIPGVYNVDPLGYMQRNPSYADEFKDLSLQGVSSVINDRQKTEMPDLYKVLSPIEIMEYNMNDSALAADAWIKVSLIDEIPSLSLVSCAPIYDCVRHMTSVEARCPLTSEAMSRSLMIDWSAPEPMEKYEGGRVFEPIKGIHDEVVVCDFSAMYPTIMIDGRISPETVVVEPPDDHEYGDMWYCDNYIRVRLEDCIGRFPRTGSCIQRDILMKFSKIRNANKATNPKYAKTVKISSNAVYGTIGYQNSPMYSPVCSSSVTAIGRLCLERARDVFESNGLKVIYGDTDSCFVAATAVTTMKFNGDVIEHAQFCLDKLHELLATTPFFSMRMALECRYKRVLLLEKKKYCALMDNDKIKYKGMSIVRRDTLGICKFACEAVCSALLRSGSITAANELIAQIIANIVYSAIYNKLSHNDVSKVAKRDQKRSYVYMGSDNKERVVPIDMSSNVVTDYSKTYVLNSVKHEILRITSPCGLGSISEIMNRSSLLF